MGMTWFCEPPGGGLCSPERVEVSVQAPEKGLRLKWGLAEFGGWRVPSGTVSSVGACRKRACVGSGEEPKRGRIDKIQLLYKLDLLL